MSVINRSKKGFTLVEIMIVVLIIGILLGIAAPQWVKARERSQRNSCLANMREFSHAKLRWAMENRLSGSAVPVQADLVPDYIKKMPVCNSSGIYTLNNVDTEASCSIHGVGDSAP